MALSEYDKHVYQDESTALEDKKQLTKIKKIIDDKRKEYKAHCLEPYDLVEPKIKELTKMLDERLEAIKDNVDTFSDTRKEDKATEIKKYYDKESRILGGYAEKLYNKIFDERWLKASASRRKYENEIKIAISDAKRDIDVLTDLNSPLTDMLIDNYINGASIEECMKKYDEYKAIGMGSDVRTDTAIPNAVMRREIDNIKNSDMGIMFKIKANKKQTEILFDFMKAFGIEFEIIH